MAGDIVAAGAEIGPGVCIAFGGSNARFAHCRGGDILGFRSEPTPDNPEEFFSWMARGVLDSAEAGNKWLVAGFPGPVSADGTQVGPMANVDGMSKQQYDLRQQLMNADPEVEDVLEQGFTMLAVNDGTLAAQAAARVIGEGKFGRVAALIVGTGIGTGLAVRDNSANVYRVDPDPLEIGHLSLNGNPSDTFESRYSGPGMEKRYGYNPKDMGPDHPAWREEGRVIGELVLTLGLMKGAELVVPTGGVGAGASDNFRYHIERFIAAVGDMGNATQQDLMPEVLYVPPVRHMEFEMFGAHGVMQDFVTR